MKALSAKSRLSFLLLSAVLVACQAGPRPLSQPAAPLRSQSAPSSHVNPLGLRLSASLLNELSLPETEAEPREAASVSDDYTAKVLGTRYVHAHSYYFDHLENGSSMIETILAHDGRSQASELVKRWRKVLSDGAVWPDRNSTTYQGRFTALEHGQVSETKGWLRFRNASSKAQEYYRLAVAAWKRELPANHPDQQEAWAWLGRTSHFLQDMSVPFHTKSFIRPAQPLFHHTYELTAEVYFDRYLPGKNHNPFNVWSGGPFPATGNWGHYYAAGTQADAMIKQLAAQSQPFYKLVNHMENSKSGNWEKSRAVLIPLGAKMTAGLVAAYLREVGALPD